MSLASNIKCVAMYFPFQCHRCAESEALLGEVGGVGSHSALLDAPLIRSVEQSAAHCAASDGQFQEGNI